MILVTGAAGFIGSAFVRTGLKPSEARASVDHQGLFQTRAEGLRIPLKDFGPKVDTQDLIALSPGALTKMFQSKGGVPQAIVHLGAITDTRESDWDKLKRFNLDYSKTLWNWASELKVPFIYASSAATYGEGELGYDDDPKQMAKLKPLNLYGQSKLDFDLWALDQKHQPPIWAGFKFFNVYGYGEDHKGFMASVVLHAFQQIQKSGQVTLFKSHKAGVEDGQQKRDFIFVEDVVKVLRFAMDGRFRSGIYNLGTGHARSFLDLAKAVFSALGRPENIQFIDTPLSIRDKYQYFTQAPMARLRAEGYSDPFHSLEEGVAKAVAWLSKRKA